MSSVASTTATRTRIYDIASNSWSLGANMPEARYDMGIGVNPATGKIYLVGGIGGGVAQSQTWEYDPVANTFTTRAPLPVALFNPASGVINGHLYVAGGSTGSDWVDTNYDYNIATNTWATRANMPGGGRNYPGSAVAQGRLWSIGGGQPFRPGVPGARPVLTSGSAPDSLADVISYDPATNSWRTEPSLNLARSFTGGTSIGSSYIITAGGYNSDIADSTDTVERLALGGPPPPASATATTASASTAASTTLRRRRRPHRLCRQRGSSDDAPVADPGGRRNDGRHIRCRKRHANGG